MAAACAAAAAAASASAALLPAASRSTAAHNARMCCRLAMSGHFQGLGCPSQMLLNDSLPGPWSRLRLPAAHFRPKVSCDLHPWGLSFLVDNRPADREQMRGLGPSLIYFIVLFNADHFAAGPYAGCTSVGTPDKFFKSRISRALNYPTGSNVRADTTQNMWNSYCCVTPLHP